MSKPNQPPDKNAPRGPEGVPLDAPDNDAPALSPHAVSRMHRAEDDAVAAANSPEFSDNREAFSHTRGVARAFPDSARSSSGNTSDSRPHGVSRDLEDQNVERGEPNPSHHTRKRPADPDGLGEGELMEQPGSTGEARDPGPDSPPLDHNK